MKRELPIEQPRSVDVAAIEQTINALWRETASGGDEAVIRASILNLVVVTDARDRAAVSEVVAELTVTHPCRAVVVLADPESSEEGISAEVSAQCHISLGKRKQVCSEMVILTARGASVAESHTVVSALVNSDLPTCLWWRVSTPPEGHLFDQLAETCNHLVLDSRLLIQRSEARSAHALLATGGRQSVGDLSWGRLNPWRAALAALYDVPSYRPHLDRLGLISIECNPSTPEPLLLAGWLAGRLGLKRRPGTITGPAPTFELTSEDRVIAMALEPAHIDTPIVGVSLVSGSPDSLSFAVRLLDDHLDTCVISGAEVKAVASVHITRSGEGRLMAEELDLLDRDLAYEEAVPVALSLASDLSKLGF